MMQSPVVNSRILPLWAIIACQAGSHCRTFLFLALQVKCLENENELLERNEKDLKENIERLLQSREAFMRQYEACVDLNICPFFWAVVTAKLNLLHCILSV